MTDWCKPILRAPDIEHVVPVSAGGKTTFRNIVPSCRACNVSKGTKEIEPWMGLAFRAFRKRWARAKSRARHWLRERDKKKPR